MRRPIFLLVCCFITALSLAQDSVMTATDTLDVIVYSQKFPEHSRRVAQTIRVIRDRATLNFQPNTADILTNTGSLFVQKSQQGGGSPVIRGFEASRIVLMVDGVRMNNAIYRAGHLQNVITVDNAILDRVEVIYGPASTLYGSDALGGVINLYTRDPRLLSASGKTVAGSAMLRYGSAASEAKGHLDFNIAGKQWASFSSLTFTSYGDVQQGKNRRGAYDIFGLKPFIVRRVGNTDVVDTNPAPHVQSPSGYRQWDILQKILFRPKPHIAHKLNLQFSNSSDVPRYDRLSETSGGNPLFAEWYYGPQERNLVAYQFTAAQMPGFFRELSLSANYQNVEESRINRRFQNNNKNFNWESLDIFGFNLDLKRFAGKHELQLGFESYLNFVQSTAERKNIVTGSSSRIQTRYSDGPTKMSYHALYTQHTLKINDRWTLNDGIRVNQVNLEAVFADTSIMHLPFNAARQQNLAFTGNIGLIHWTPGRWKFAVVLSSGFRAPNVDDLTKVFDTRVGAVIVPNPSTKPEYTYNAEFNIARLGDKISYGASVFYTAFRNVLVIDRARFNDQDSILYQGVQSAVFSAQNKARGYIYGFNTNLTILVLRNTKLDGTLSYTFGRYRSDLGEVPLDHIPPVYGRVSLTHQHQRWQMEGYVLFNGWKRISDYSPSGEDNQQYATADGMPAWMTCNVKGGFRIKSYLELQLAIENMLDRNYRHFASGISAPGRNLVISARLNF